MHNGENERDWAWGLELTNALRIRGRDRKRQDGYVDDVTMIHDNLSPLGSSHTTCGKLEIRWSIGVTVN